MENIKKKSSFQTQIIYLFCKTEFLHEKFGINLCLCGFPNIIRFTALTNEELEKLQTK